MVCIYCSSKTQVTNVRHKTRLKAVWRRRRCLACQAVFTSVEEADLASTLSVQKRRGYLEPFSPDKLFLSIYNSLIPQKDATRDARALCDTVISKILKQPATHPILSRDIATFTQQTLSRYKAPAGQRYKSYQSEK